MWIKLIFQKFPELNLFFKIFVGIMLRMPTKIFRIAILRITVQYH